MLLAAYVYFRSRFLVGLALGAVLVTLGLII